MPRLTRIPARAREVTQEPFSVAPDLLGAPLATFRRRGTAIIVDTLLFGLVVGSLFVGLSLWSIQREDPTLLRRVRAAASGQLAAAEKPQLGADLLRLVEARAPGTLPCDLADHLAAGTLDQAVAAWGERDLTISLGSGRSTLTSDDNRYTLMLGTDVTLGEFSGFFSWGACFVAWFTALTRLGRGCTPGKALCRVRVVRLDGRGLRWWDAFGRAGGYGASAATLMLGFLEMIWDPNRQALHDRIAGTVVLRLPRSGRVSPAGD